MREYRTLLATMQAPMALVDHEISQGLQPPVAPGDQPTVVLLRLRGRPVGVARTDGQHARSWVRQAAAAIAPTVAHQLATEALFDPASRGTLIERLVRPPGKLREARVSVAVCTRDRPESLRRCLHALVSLDPPPQEILVVDNAPTSGSTETLVRQEFPAVRYLREPVAGLDRARNRALQEATAPVVAFTDDDCRVDRGWAGAVATCFARNPEIAMVTGLVVPDALDTEAQRLFELYGGFGRGTQRRWAVPTARRLVLRFGNTGTLGTGASLAVRRDIARAMGGFDPALDVGTPTGGGGDLELCFRTLKWGHGIAYEPGAIVHHTHRETFEELREQIRGWGTGMQAYLTRTREHFPEERLSVTAFRTWFLVSWFLKRLVASFLHQSFPRGLILDELRGSWAGARRYRQSRIMHPFAPPEPPPPSSPTVVAEHHLRLGELVSALPFAPEVGQVLVHVSQGQRTLARVSLVPLHGIVGADRLADGVGASCMPALLGLPHDTVYRQVQRAIEDLA